MIHISLIQFGYNSDPRCRMICALPLSSGWHLRYRILDAAPERYSTRNTGSQSSEISKLCDLRKCQQLSSQDPTEVPIGSPCPQAPHEAQLEVPVRATGSDPCMPES